MTPVSPLNSPLPATPPDLPGALIAIRYFRRSWIECRHLCPGITRSQTVFLLMIAHRAPSGRFRIAELTLPGLRWQNGRMYVVRLRRYGLVIHTGERGFYELTPAGRTYVQAFMTAYRDHIAAPEHW